MSVDAHNCRAALSTFVQRAEYLGVTVGAVESERFAMYCQTLCEASSRLNVTGIRTPEGIMTRLFLDSLTILPALPARFISDPTPVRVIDIGTGAGIPGVPLKIVRPHWSLTLVESTTKKARFLEGLITALDLREVQVVAKRAEEIASEINLRDTGDLCVARAVGALPSLIELCAPFVRVGGLLVFPKSGDVDAEIAVAKPAAAELRVRLLSVYPVPNCLELGMGHAVVLYEKTGVTPSRFPRRIGLAKSQPIASRASVTRERPRGRPGSRK